MNGHNYLFSNEGRYRLLRHTTFWVLWWAYFTVIYFHFQQTGLQTIGFDRWSGALLVKSVCLLAVHMVATYSFTAYLLPGFLHRGPYLLPLAGSGVLAVFIVATGYYLHREVFPLVEAAFRQQPLKAAPGVWWPSISSGLLSAPKVIAAASAIKLGKRWYRQQKEKERLEAEKLATDLQLLKAQIHPRFLFTSLGTLQRLARRRDTAGASDLLLKLADLLSYTLYEGARAWVPLEAELRTLVDYMALEKTRLGNRLELDLSLRGEAGNKTIAPLLLLPFVEAAFAQCNDKRMARCWMNVEVRMDNEGLLLKLIHGKAPGNAHAPNSGLSNVQKRLELLYPGAYELKTTVEPEMMMTALKLSLNNASAPTITPKQPNLYATV